jgi:hypothetical protein
MRTLNRNKVEFYYALYEGKEPVTIVDEWGNTIQTGEYQVIHGNPIQSAANISPAKGETQMQQFGEDDSYDKVIVVDKDAPTLDEFSWLWIDTMPKLNNDGSLEVDEYGNIITPHDYDIKRVAKSINSVSYAISKVNVNGN